MLRLITWNVNAGVGRLRGQADVLAAQRLDVIALQEVTARTVESWRAALVAAGMPHVVASFDLAPEPAVLVGPRRYGEVLAARYRNDRWSAGLSDHAALSVDLRPEPPG